MTRSPWFHRVGKIASIATFLFLLTVTAHAAQIAFFDNNTYVDSEGGGENSCGAESENLQASIASFGGHTVTTFTGIEAADFEAALDGKQILVIPELENGDLAPDLSAEAIAVIANFVQSGGRLLVFADSNEPLEALLNTVFGFSLVVDGSPDTSNKTAAAVGTLFENGPDTLPYNNGTGYIQASTLPADALNIYNYNDNSEDFAVVAILPFGAGEVIFMGYDWFDSNPSADVGCEGDGQDGGWQNVLQLALATFEADLQISKSADVETAEVGDQIAFTIAVTNNGPDTAGDVLVSDSLPASASLVSVNASQGSCSGTAPITCELGSLEEGATATVTLVVTADEEGILTNQAEVSSTTEDLDPDNNTASASVTVINSTPAVPNISGSGCSLATESLPNMMAGYIFLGFVLLCGFISRKALKQ